MQSSAGYGEDEDEGSDWCGLGPLARLAGPIGSSCRRQSPTQLEAFYYDSRDHLFSLLLQSCSLLLVSKRSVCLAMSLPAKEI